MFGFELPGIDGPDLFWIQDYVDELGWVVTWRPVSSEAAVKAMDRGFPVFCGLLSEVESNLLRVRVLGRESFATADELARQERAQQLYELSQVSLRIKDEGRRTSRGLDRCTIKDLMTLSPFSYYTFPEQR